MNALPATTTGVPTPESLADWLIEEIQNARDEINRIEYGNVEFVIQHYQVLHVLVQHRRIPRRRAVGSTSAAPSRKWTVQSLGNESYPR